jgi:hypothetical protein
MGAADTIGGNPFTVAGITGVPIFDPTVRDWQNRIDTQATHRALAKSIEQWSSQGVIRR